RGTAQPASMPSIQSWIAGRQSADEILARVIVATPATGEHKTRPPHAWRGRDTQPTHTPTHAARQRVFIFITERSCPKSNVILKKLRSYAFEKSSRAA